MSESSDIQAAGQHYLVCGTEDCKKNGQFYCNACHKPMCEQCRNEHLNGPDTKSHEVVLYRQRKHQLPVVECKHHPTRNVDVFCNECKISLCLKCFKTKEHKGHEFDDLEDTYAEKYALWQGEFSKIQKYFLPISEGMKRDIGEDVKEIENIMESIRTSMKTEAESLKNLVDEVTGENIEHTHTMEKSLTEMLKSQETKYDDYIAYLEKTSDEFQEYLSLTSRKILFLEILKIKTIPETTKPVPPVFTAGQFNKDDVAKLLGKVNVPNTEPEKRQIKPMESVSTHMKFIEKQLEPSLEKSGLKQTLSLSSSVTKVREYIVPGVKDASHVSADKSGRLWVSDNNGNLVQTDLQGNLLWCIKTSGRYGYHTVTQNGGLIYTDKDKGVIYTIKPDKTITKFNKTGDWKPLGIHSFRINGDILVGMQKNGEAKVTRYNKIGQEIQNIWRDNQGQELYSLPHYVTENINGDICTSDHNKDAVVVVSKSGQHRFSYKGQGLEFRPYGICTDVLGHILVCVGILHVHDMLKLFKESNELQGDSVRLLNQDGEFLSIILSEEQGVEHPRGVCVDDENNLQCLTIIPVIGQYFNIPKMRVYKYLK